MENKEQNKANFTNEFYAMLDEMFGFNGGAAGGQDYYDADYTVVDDDK